MNVIAGIVTFNPNIDKLKENLSSVISQVDEIVIADNGSANVVEIEKLIDKYDGLQLINNKKNLGIAAALNQLCHYGKEKGYQWILTLDQDSVCPHDMLEHLVSSIKPNTAIVAPNIIYRNNAEYAEQGESGAYEVAWVITSASLTNLNVWEHIGGFDEALFIDGVDKDFCFRARLAGYVILKCYDTILLHELGNLKCIKVFGKVIYVTHHSAGRKYYMARNAIYLDKKYGTREAFRSIIKLVTKTVLFEKQKIDKSFQILGGVVDGMKMKPVRLMKK